MTTTHPVFHDAPAEMPAMDDATYYGDCDAVSNSMLKILAARKATKYHAHFIARTLEFEEPTRQMELGTAIHACVLEGKLLDGALAVIPRECLNVNGGIVRARVDAFEATLPKGCTAVKADEYLGARRSVEAILQRYGKLLESPNVLREQAVYWTNRETGIRCRAKIDIIVPLSNGTILVPDLKTTDDAEPSEFRRKIISQRYWLQQATYTEGLQEFYDGAKIDFRFVAIEREGLCQVSENKLRIAEESQAMDSRNRLMRQLAERYESGDWSDDWEKQCNEVSLPDYAFGF